MSFQRCLCVCVYSFLQWLWKSFHISQYVESLYVFVGLCSIALYGCSILYLSGLIFMDINRHLGCFQSFGITNSATVNNLVHTSYHKHISRNIFLKGYSIYKLDGHYQIALHRRCTNLHSQQHVWDLFLYPIPPNSEFNNWSLPMW